jgi:aspartate ammonia-lyase
MPRIERDALGEVSIPDGALWGAHAQRSHENFPISGRLPRPQFLAAGAEVKRAAAIAHGATGRLDRAIVDAIVWAADQVIAGKHLDQFIVDVYQAGAGTSFNMNMNEVLGSLASLHLGGKPGDHKVSAHDHVNMGQSTNDIFPTTMRVAAAVLWHKTRQEALALADAFADLARRTDDVLKTGRTHLQDAVPIRYGQEFSGYADALRQAVEQTDDAVRYIYELNMGATANGTGLNAEPGYPEAGAAELARKLGLPFRPPRNRFRITQSLGDFVFFSSGLQVLAIELSRIASDLRLLSSGPHAGIGEVQLPAVQPGSSIMPGKVNPSIPEMVNMVALDVIGGHATIATAAQYGQLELNVMMPIVADRLVESLLILGSACETFRSRCVVGIKVDGERSLRLLEGSGALSTAVAPYVGYAKAAELQKEANASGRSVRDLVVEQGLLTAEQADRVLDLRTMTEPGVAG